MKCQYLHNGRCDIVEQRTRTVYIVDSRACEDCARQPAACTWNKVTAGLAIGAFSRSNHKHKNAIIANLLSWIIRPEPTFIEILRQILPWIANSSSEFQQYLSSVNSMSVETILSSLDNIVERIYNESSRLEVSITKGYVSNAVIASIQRSNKRPIQAVADPINIKSNGLGRMLISRLPWTLNKPANGCRNCRDIIEMLDRRDLAWVRKHLPIISHNLLVEAEKRGVSTSTEELQGVLVECLDSIGTS